ncbi:hypothetical protein TNCV_7101 [Trichonephila clavipes]|nr:hypothetical protein TNCV_7101 [Trichonephila clavipes]
MVPPHMNMIIITAQIEYKFVIKDNPVPFHCSPISSCATPLQMEASLVGVMGTAIPDVLQPGALRWSRKTQGPVVKVLPVSRQWPMRQLTLRMCVV